MSVTSRYSVRAAPVQGLDPGAPAGEFQCSARKPPSPARFAVMAVLPGSTALETAAMLVPFRSQPRLAASIWDSQASPATAVAPMLAREGRAERSQFKVMGSPA